MINCIWVEADNRWAFGVSGEGAVKITQAELTRLLDEQSKGKRIVKGGDGKPTTAEQGLIDNSRAERIWRNSELVVADIELNKVQDSDTNAVGTVSQWREYRKALRAWPEHSEFPDKAYRPVSPLIKE